LAYIGDTDAVVAEINAVLPEAASFPPPVSGSFRTILFTDVEDSTDLVVQHGDAHYRALLAEHERLVREALSECGGNEIKTIGDSFMCWFSSASSAINAAQAMQTAIMAHYGDDLRIRIGVHAGEPIVEDDDLWGTSVVRASRIMNKADGGQILVSQVVMDLVEGKGYLFHDAGEFALKGYEHAVHLFDVKWEGE
jgi:adenylate cyclase